MSRLARAVEERMVRVYADERELMQQWHGEVPTDGEDFAEFGDALNYFLEFCVAIGAIAKGIDSAESLAKRVRSLITWATRRKSKPVTAASVGERILALVYHDAYTQGSATTQRLATLLGIPLESAREEIKRLVELGLLREMERGGFVPPFQGN